MLISLLKYRFLHPVTFVRFSTFIRSNTDLGKQMKSLNDNKQFQNTLELFDKQEKNNRKQFSSLIITQALKACTHLKDLQRGMNIHRLVSSTMKDDVYVTSSLIHLYSNAMDEMARAQSLFDEAKEKTTSIYGAMMKGYLKNNRPNKAIELFQQIQSPDEVNVIIFFNACAQLENSQALDSLKKVSKNLPKRFYKNPRLVTSQIDAFMKCGAVQQAQLLFDKIKRKTMEMYGAMMKGFVKNNLSDKAVELFQQIQGPDIVVVTILLNACAQLQTSEALDIIKSISRDIPLSFYKDDRLLTSRFDALIKCGDSSSAEKLMIKMKKTVESYGNLMNGFLEENNFSKIINLFNQMKTDGISPNLIIYLCILRSLSQIGNKSLCKSIVKQIPQDLLNEKEIQNSLIDMWGKIGCVIEAEEIFRNISQVDRIGYTSMINCYGLNGMGTQAIDLFSKIPKEFLDEVTYICILYACSHAGLIAEARSIFQTIKTKTERIYATMVDGLSRASVFEEAQTLINEYERSKKPGLSMNMALLSGARNANNTELAERTYSRMKTLFPEMIDPLTAAAVLLSNVYSSSGQTDKASKIKNEIQRSGIKKKIGLTWTVIDGDIYQFRAHDQSHPRSLEIYEEVKKISKELLQYGHQYDSSWVTRKLNEDETIESVLYGHSERLAIAWNFVLNPNASQIQLTKNLRVCGDCHRATKSIAAIRQCEIIVRDATRIHHFYKNGQCSCNDYF